MPARSSDIPPARALAPGSRFAAGPRGAVLSRGRRYRYLLWRRWNEGPRLVLFVGLNPSTADATSDDPTIRRCIGFARRLGADGMLVANLFAWRATRVRDLFAAREPVGRANDRWLSAACRLADPVIACWGAHGAHRGRSSAVALPPVALYCFGTTAAGEPRHPLYLRRETPLLRFVR